jgi:hypothetical protein
VEGQSDLSRQVGQHAVIVFGETVTVRRSFDDDETQKLSGMADRGHTELRPFPPVQEAGNHTEAQALPETPARVTTGRSRLETTRESGPLSGTDTTRSSTSPIPV